VVFRERRRAAASAAASAPAGHWSPGAHVRTELPPLTLIAGGGDSRSSAHVFLKRPRNGGGTRAY
jgi:hypothetical protein